MLLAWQSNPTAESGPTPRVATSMWPGYDALQLEGPMTNLIQNPSFEVDTIDWTNLNGSVITRVGTDFEFGAYCLDVVCDGAATFKGARWARGSGLPNNTTYTASFYIKAATGADVGKTVQTNLSFNGGSGDNLGSVILTANWQRITLTAASGVGSTDVFIDARMAAAAAAHFLIDGVQLEAGDYRTSYTDGSLGTGYAWTGTPNASTSTRAAGYCDLPLLAPVLSPMEGSVVVWMERMHDCDQGPADKAIFSWAADVNSYLSLTMTTAEEIHLNRKAAGVGASSVVPCGTGNAFTPAFIYGGWDATVVECGEGGTIGSPTANTSLPSVSDVPYVGGAPALAPVADALFSGVAFFSRRLTASEFSYFAGLTRPPTPGELVGDVMLALFIAADQ